MATTYVNSGFHRPCFRGNAGDAQKKEKVYAMFAQYSKEFPEVKVILPVTAMETVAAGKAVLVDGREQAEMDVSMLPGAIPVAEFLKAPNPDGNKTVIVYCTIGYRSGKLAGSYPKEVYWHITYPGAFWDGCSKEGAFIRMIKK
jgi:rhodanese-related sulfurtransferase